MNNDSFDIGDATPMVRRTLKENFAGNVIWNFAGQGWLLIVAFAATPFIVHRLGTSLYGIYVIIGVVIDYFAFMQLGMGAASIKYIAQYMARGDHRMIKMTYWTGLLSHFALGALGMVIIISLAHVLVDRLFNVPPNLRETALFAMRVGSAGFLISLLSGMTSGVIQALGRFDIMNMMGIVFGTLQIGMAVILLMLGYSLNEIIVSNVVVQALGCYLYWYFARKLLPVLRGPAWNRNVLFDLLKFGGFVTISSIVGPILANIEKIFLTALRSVSMLTYYAVPFSLVNRLSVIPSAFSSVLYPIYSFYHEAAEGSVKKDLHFRSTLYLALIFCLPVFFMIFFGKEFLLWWIGEEFAARSTNILIILGIAGLVNAVAYPSITGLQGMGMPQWPALFHVIETILYIPGGYFLIKTYGSIGAAIAWAMRVLLDTLLLQGTACRMMNEPIAKWYMKLLRKSFAPVLFLSVMFWLLSSLGLGLFHTWTIFGMVMITALYGLIVWTWSLDEVARDRLRKIVKKR